MKIFNIVLLIICLVIIFLFSCEDGYFSRRTSIKTISTGINCIKKITGSDNKQKSSNEIITSKYNTSKILNKKSYKNANKTVIINNKVEDNLFFVRKTAHIFEYFILGILMLNVLRYYCNLNFKLVNLSVILCILYACTDEIHQLFVPGRTGKITDVLIDSIGIILGSFFFYFVLKIRLKKNRLEVI